jgi:diguanylate cyclase (GGDEF)-like protein
MQMTEGPISRKIILYSLLMVSLYTVLGLMLIDRYLSNTALHQYERDLIRLARGGAQLLDFLDSRADTAEFDYFADTFAENDRFRVTIISIDGVVLGDSRLSLQEVRTIENHSERPEVIAAKEAGTGVSKRYSSTLQADLLYVAVKYNSLGRQGYFRISLPLIELKQEQLKQRVIIASFGIIALLIAVSLSLFSSRHLISLIHQERHELERRVVKGTKELEMLQNLGTQLTACNTKQEALEVLRLVASLLLPHYRGSLALLRSSRDKLEIATSWNDAPIDHTIYVPNQCWALRTGKIHLGNPNTGNMTCDHFRSEHEQMLCIPLIAQGETHGVLHLSSSRERAWTSNERQLASAIAEHASLTLASLDLRESLRQQAIRDALTGLYNRRYLLETIDHELSRAARRNLQIGILMIDIDNFKNFNDEHGHDIGDFILSEFGRLIRLILREEDIACRYGGEEFTLLLPDTGREGTIKVAEKICRTTREHDFTVAHRAYGPITLSIGASTFPENGDSSEILIKTADEALYSAKEQGRNRAILAPLPHA